VHPNPAIHRIEPEQRRVKIALISCGTEWSGIQLELDRAAKSVGAELFFPTAEIEDIDLGVKELAFAPASHALRVMLGQAIVLERYRDTDGVLILTCFRCAEGALVRLVIRRYLQKRFHLPIITYSFTERTKTGNLLLRMEALANLIVRQELLKVRNHHGTSLGIDSGSSWTKCVLMENGQILGSSALPTTDIVDTAVKVADRAINGANTRFEIGFDPLGVTGYGRHILNRKFNPRIAIDEITVCSKGATYLSNNQEGDTTVIDIGGNDNKAITTHDGVPDGFTVGGLCAGASGRFLEVAAARMGVNLEEFSQLAMKGDPEKVGMNAYCIVFGLQDITSALAAGLSKADVAAAACNSVAEQFFEQQLQEIEIRRPVIQVGTTSLNKGLVKAMENVIGTHITVPVHSQYAGAVGAALLASCNSTSE
jgi:putative methanogenesis marker protein 15